MSSDRFASIEYNIANSSWHFGPNGSLWTGLSLTKVVDIPVHKLPYGPKCHELFVKYKPYKD